jgi:di/tricarboxylate transporter
MQKKLLCLGVALAVMLSIIFLTPEMKGLQHAGKVALGVGVFAITVWITQALDDAQSGFCIVAFLVLFGGARMAQAMSGFASTGVWIVMLGMVMAGGMERSGLSRRMPCAWSPWLAPRPTGCTGWSPLSPWS